MTRLRVDRLAGGLEQIRAVDRETAIAALDLRPRQSRRRYQCGQPAAQVRRWAKTNGVPVPRSGPIPNTVRAAYEAAHQPKTGDA